MSTSVPFYVEGPNTLFSFLVFDKLIDHFFQIIHSVDNFIHPVHNLSGKIFHLFLQPSEKTFDLKDCKKMKERGKDKSGIKLVVVRIIINHSRVNSC